MISTRRRRTGDYAWLAALTMTVLAVSPLLAIFHQISARHAVCEHGELVESGHDALSGDLTEVAEWAVHDAESVPASDIRPASDAVLHGHSHCSLGTLAKNHVGIRPRSQVVTALSEVALGAPHHCEFAYVHTILLSAPKTSPPSVLS